MFAKLKTENFTFAFLVRAVLAPVILGVFLTVAASAQTVSSNAHQSADPKTTAETDGTAAQPAVSMPLWKNDKDVALDMTADEVKEKLGKAKIADKDGFYYEFSDEESAQIALDAEGRVRALTIIYKVKGGNPPKIEDVLGTDAAADLTAGGAAYKLVRYPQAGSWVAHNRTTGDDAIVTVTLQKF